MRSKPPIRQISWPMVFLELGWLGVLTMGGALLFYDELGIQSFALGAGWFLIHSFGVKALLTQSQRRGMYLTRHGYFEQAIPVYKQSYAFFRKHWWIDRYRALTLLTPSAMSYREMALINIAYCYAQLGEGQQAKSTYERVLAEFPNNRMAKSTLNLINSIENAAAE
jgi:tetratricopeptide (TPR) repeat protein